MRNLLLAAVGAIALAGGATTANAAVVVSNTTLPADLTSPGLTAPTTFGVLANLSNGPGTFSNTYNFSIVGGSALFNGQVSSVEGPGATHNINFTAPTLTQGATTLATFLLTSTDPNPETWSILPASAVLLAPGTYTLNIAGTLNGGTGTYGGNFNLSTAAVPEPATWAMMLLGFGAMGMVVRRRRKPVLAQLA